MAERICPACGQPMTFKELAPIQVKRKPPLPPVTINVCCRCFETTARVLLLIEPYYPQQLVFPDFEK